MLDIHVIAVGTLKEPHFKAAADEYLKRLRPFAKVQVHELPFAPFTESHRTQAKRKEAERVEKALAPFSGASIFLLDERGKGFTSETFATFLEKIPGQMVFVIGGTLGFDETILKLPHQKIALSQLTLPHHLARVVLLEQLYRAATIVNQKTYHY